MSKPQPPKPPQPKNPRGPADNRPPNKPAAPPKRDMTPAEWGRAIAATWPPITDEQAEAAARILARWITSSPAPASP